MIIVVEGISAAGKTTWCHRCAREYLIKESYPEKRPDRHAGPSEAARLWTEWMQNDGPTLLQWNWPKVLPFATRIL